MANPQLTTAFRFVCVQCSHANEYLHQHPAGMRPHLVSSRCSECQTLNWLGSLKGTLAKADAPGLPEAAPPAAIGESAIAASPQRA